MLHQRDEEEMMLGEFLFPEPLRSFRLQSALHSAMSTSKNRDATGPNEVVDSGQIQALTKLGGSEPSRGTTAAFRGMLVRSATNGDADVAVAPKDVFVQDGEPHEDLPGIEETHLTIKTSDQRPRLRRNVACGRACRHQRLTEKCGSLNPRRAVRRIHSSTLEVHHRRR